MPSDTFETPLPRLGTSPPPIPAPPLGTSTPPTKISSRCCPTCRRGSRPGRVRGRSGVAGGTAPSSTPYPPGLRHEIYPRRIATKQRRRGPFPRLYRMRAREYTHRYRNRRPQSREAGAKVIREPILSHSVRNSTRCVRACVRACVLERREREPGWTR